MVFGWDDVLAIGAPIIGGILGGNAASEGTKAQTRALEANRAALNAVELPDIEKQKLALQQYLSAGEFNPEILQQLQQVGPSALENVQLDPRLRQSQMTALEQMSNKAMGKMSDADMAAFELARKKAAGETQAKSAQILQQMQARGQGGSGAALAAQLSNAQAGGNMLQDAALQEAVAQQKARESALMNMGNMAQSLRSQDYGQASDLASRRDAINQMNINAANQLAQQNVATRNQAAAGNLANRQQLSNQNVNLANQQQMNNKGLLQQDYANRIARAGGNAQLNNQAANLAAQQAQNQGSMYGQVGQGLAGLASAYFNQAQPVKKLPFDPSDFNKA